MKKDTTSINLSKDNKQEIQTQKNNKNQKQKEKINKLIKIFVALVFIFGGFKIFFPEHFRPALNMSSLYAKEMASIFPAVLLLMGLAEVWVPSSLIKKYLGQRAGIKGKVLAVVLGTLPTGPMYIAFPLAAELLRKKASISNIIIFLGIWGSLKIPQISIEVKFLGLKFASLRFIFTLISVFIMGFIIEKLAEKKSSEKEE